VYIIRNRGFFYTDEYYSPEKTFRQVRKTVFATKEAADKACAAMVRRWVRHVRLDDFLWDQPEPIARVMEYLRAEFDYLELDYHRDLEIPREATDEQVDEIVKRMGITFAEVHPISWPQRLWTKADETQHRVSKEQSADELWFGPGWDDRTPAERKRDGDDSDDEDEDDEDNDESDESDDNDDADDDGAGKS
jgi:hypothetical protein